MYTHAHRGLNFGIERICCEHHCDDCSATLQDETHHWSSLLHVVLSQENEASTWIMRTFHKKV